MSLSTITSGLSLLLLAGCAATGRWTLRGTWVCVDCGRTERQEWCDDQLKSSELVASGADYAERFRVDTSKGHEHEWHLESGFSTEPGNICCTMVMVEGWFRALPKLKDRAAADALYRDAQALPFKERCDLMSWVDLDVWLGYELNHEDLDVAFRLWLEKHRGEKTTK